MVLVCNLYIIHCNFHVSVCEKDIRVSSIVASESAFIPLSSKGHIGGKYIHENNVFRVLVLEPLLSFFLISLLFKKMPTVSDTTLAYLYGSC